MAAAPPTIFLLSPASLGGRRAQMLLREQAMFPLAQALRTPSGAPLAEVFTFCSALYFRGKAAYARAFAGPPRGVAGAFVITSAEGLLPLDTSVDAARLRALAGIPIDAREPRYREPLVHAARALDAQCGPRCRIVLLGSVATGKYVDPLQDVFADRLLFPSDFVGRGDMSRGGLLLRSAAAGVELSYVPVIGAVRHGVRPPRLPPPRRRR